VSPLLIGLTMVFFFASAISTLDKRLTQGKTAGTLPADEPELPAWTVIFDVLRFGALVGVLIINWKFGLAMYAIGFILAVLPVLETVGNVLAAFIVKPFMRR